MGLSNSPDIFQENMSNLFRDLTFVREYIDDLLITSNGSLQDHLDKVAQVLEKLQKAGLKVNANKSKFCRTEVEYLGYLITREGINPKPKRFKLYTIWQHQQLERNLEVSLGL